MRKLLIILGGIIFTGAVIVGIIDHDHPIFLKYLVGEASKLGKPVFAKVYTNGHINYDIKVYREARYKNDYLIHLKNHDTADMLEYIDVDLDHNSVGRTICSAKDCYDIIDGYMFQSETGAKFADFKDDMKGADFDPNLAFSNYEIKFNIPPHRLKFDSLRIELDHR